MDADLAARAARVASGSTLRWAALRGILLAFPLLVAGAIVARLPHPDLAALTRPVSYVVHPLVHAWRHDLDSSLLGYLILQGTLLSFVAARLTTDLGRRAAYFIATSTPLPEPDARAFLRRRWGSTFRARALRALALLVPAVLALFLVAWSLGTSSAVLRVLCWVAALPLAFGAVAAFAIRVIACYVSEAHIAVEDTRAMPALGIAFAHALVSPWRTFGKRAYFGARALVGIVARGLFAAGVGALLFFGLRLVVGEDAMTRSLAVLEAGGVPADAARLGVGTGDRLLALVLATGLAALFLLWLANACARVVTARIAAYLALRHDLEHVEPEVLGPFDPASTHVDAEKAGFVEIERLP